MAQNERFERAQAEVGLLKGELTWLYMENKTLQDQLNVTKDEAGVTAASAVFEYQSSAEMAALRQTIRDKTFEEATESFAYTTATHYLD